MSDAEHELQDRGTPADIAFTVVIPAYNAGTLLREALESVAAQQHRPAWIVVVDDGSRDNTGDNAARWLADLGLPGEVVCQENRGISAARNAGLSRRRTGWVALLDADDLWLPDHLQRLAAAVASYPDAVAAFGDSRYFGDADAPDGLLAGARASQVAERSVAPGVQLLSTTLFDALLPGLFIPVSASAFRLDGAEWRFDPGLRTGEDRYFFLQLCQRGRFLFVERQTARTRRHAHNTTHHSQEARRHEDLVTLMTKIGQSSDFRLDAGQRASLARLTGDAVNQLMYSSSCNGLKAHLRARRRVATELRAHSRPRIRDLLRAIVHSATLRPSR